MKNNNLGPKNTKGGNSKVIFICAGQGSIFCDLTSLF